jgi:hypothetical protein
MKKSMLTIAFAVMIAAGASAQKAFISNKEGAVLTYASKDAKGKAVGYSRQTVKKVEGSGANYTVTIATEALDKAQQPIGNPPVEVTGKYTVRDNVLIFDLTALLGGNVPQTKGAEVEITGTAMELPSNLQPGQKLKDSSVTLNMGLMKSTVEITDFECVAIEDITVEAGTFKCHKISQVSNAKVMGIKTKTKTLSWFAPGIGTVKGETYSDKDKLLNVTELVAVK